MLASSSCPLRVSLETASPLVGAVPGTSGLRKKTAVFAASGGAYLRGFAQAMLDAQPEGALQGATLVLGGDGRFFSRPAVQHILRLAAAAGVARVRVGRGGLLSTPAVSALIRACGAAGGVILTASHNPGGPDADFGIKYNCANGGPAPEALTAKMAQRAASLSRLLVCAALPDIDLDSVGETVFHKKPMTEGSVTAAAAVDEEAAAAYARVAPVFTVEVVDPVAEYEALLETVFDFPKLRAFVSRPNFTLAYDALNGVAGPYGRRILVDRLGAPAASLHHCEPLPDFGGLHPDPNLTYAEELVARMGLRPDGTLLPDALDVPDFGAAQDGDADRNMVLGRRFFVTPSDSVAVIAAQAHAIPFFARGGLRAVARSMPTSAALDRVAAARGLRLFEVRDRAGERVCACVVVLYERRSGTPKLASFLTPQVPTGWKFFGNVRMRRVCSKCP